MNIFTRRIGAVLAVTAVMATGGCASAPDGLEQQLGSAETSIELAEQNGARKYGTQALERARDQLEQARRAADDGDYERAERLAVRAELDAELAAAQADRHQAEDALSEINDSIQTLREEIARNQTKLGGQS